MAKSVLVSTGVTLVYELVVVSMCSYDILCNKLKNVVADYEKNNGLAKSYAVTSEARFIKAVDDIDSGRENCASFDMTGSSSDHYFSVFVRRVINGKFKGNLVVEVTANTFAYLKEEEI